MTPVFIIPVVVVLAPQVRNATGRRGARKQSDRQEPRRPTMITGRTPRTVR
jgi:hypothetical protein